MLVGRCKQTKSMGLHARHSASRIAALEGRTAASPWCSTHRTVFRETKPRNVSLEPTFTAMTPVGSGSTQNRLNDGEKTDTATPLGGPLVWGAIRSEAATTGA